MAVKIATPAKIIVVSIIPIVVYLFFIIFTYFHPKVIWCISPDTSNVDVAAGIT